MPPTRRDAAALPLHPVARLQSLWGRWFFLPLLPVLYAAVLFAFGGQVRPEHFLFVAAGLGLGLAGPKSALLYRDLLPFVLTALGYDCVRYARALWVTRERVLGCQLRDAEARLFSVGQGVTLPEWFAAHHSPVFDVVAAVPYAVFAYFALGYAVWLWFRDRPRMRWFLWSFALANAISFVTWIVLPAAPPWYLHAHGCAIDLAAAPSPAGLARVDQLFGIHYFASFYSRAASVFGALPSMHCAYPILGLLTAWNRARWTTRPLHLIYAIWMASAAVYLEHHWVIDVLGGWATASLGVFLASRLLASPEHETAAVHAAGDAA